MTSQSEGTCPLRFLRQYVDFGCSFQKTKKCRIICSIFDTITPAWLNHSVRLSSAAQHCALEPITHDAVELVNVRTNQRRSDESSLICLFSPLGGWLKTSFWRPCVLLMTAFVPQGHICVYVYTYTHTHHMFLDQHYCPKHRPNPIPIIDP